MKINESNFKIRCLKDDDIENNISNEVFFYKNEIINVYNGTLVYPNKGIYANFEFKNYESFLEEVREIWDESYFELIEVDGFTQKEYYEYKAQQELLDMSKEEKENNFTIDLNMINKLTKLDTKSLLERTLKLSEECGEVAEATLSYLGTNGSDYKNKQLDDVIEENLDVIMVAISNISQVLNYKADKNIQDLFDTKLQKWYNKCCCKYNDK